MAGKFDSKSFNAEAFKYSVQRVPNLAREEMFKSGAFTPNEDIRTTFATENGTGYARVAYRGLIDGAPVNYDGGTNIPTSTTKSMDRGVVVVGRAKGWVERDFAYDITGGVDFMDNVAAQVAKYWDGVKQGTIYSILKGIFSMTGTKNQEFVSKHTTDITAVGDGKIGATTINTAGAKGLGDNKNALALMFCNSIVATQLENLNLIEYLKYTDEQGIRRDLTLGTVNGKLVFIDDGIPTREGYVAAASTDTGALKVVANGATSGQINLADVKAADFYPSAVAADDYVLPQSQNVTYVLGVGAFDYEDLGAKVPYEMARDAATNGGEDKLYTRDRYVLAPAGISYEKTAQASPSPTDAELENGGNWTLVNSGESVAANRTYIDHRAVPIIRILSL